MHDENNDSSSGDVKVRNVQSVSLKTSITRIIYTAVRRVGYFCNSIFVTRRIEKNLKNNFIYNGCIINFKNETKKLL